MSTFLLEIGTEEIPHWMIPGALSQLAKLDLFGATPQVDATPRRLIVRATGLPDRTPDQEQLVKGPSISAGDKAAAGFAKKQGVDLSAMQKAGDYYELRKQIPGRPVRDLLAESLPGSILGIQWPKTMYWGAKGSPRFIRPIRWIVALLNDEIINFEVAGVRSGRVTRGHRLKSQSIEVTIANYKSTLYENLVIVSAEERRGKILRETESLGAATDSDLLETLTYITEYPTAIRGEFDKQYLALPKEVLIEVMRHHQRYFPVPGPTGIAPYFVAVMNVPADPHRLVQHGNERVLKARFSDAGFFWDVDQKKKLKDRVEDLKHVTFHAKLGSYFEKTQRVVGIVQELGGNMYAVQAARLAKADLTTEMVKEFTDLQGVVGGLYAEAQGESQNVVWAIYEHYKPLSMDDSVPGSHAGQILSIADKLDNLREFFRIGMIPSGSKDPFALRRAAQGIVKILVEKKLPYTLPSLTRTDVALNDFMRERIDYYFRQRFKYDEVNAAMAAGVTTLADLEGRLKKIAAVRSTPDFEPLAASFKRINNILKQANFTPGVLDPSLLEAGPERELYDAFAEKDFSNLEGIAQLRPVVDRFFDKIMVNVPEEKIRANRLTLLHNLLTKFSTIADFSEIVTSGDQK